MPLIPDRSGSSFAADRASLAEVDPVEVAADCGALSLLTSNGHRLLRLGLLTTLAAERKVEEAKEPLGRNRLRQLLTEGDVASHADRQEDPFEDELTEEVSFFGGPYLVGSGMQTDANYVLRLLIRTLLLTDRLPDEAQAELTRLTGAALKLSNHALRSAGLGRHELPSRSPNEPIEIPGQSRLRAGAAQLTLTPERVKAVLGDLDPAAIEPLILDGGARTFSDEELVDGAADVWPILRFGEQLVLARPYGLALALNHQLLLRAAAELGTEVLAAAFGDAVAEDVRLSLLRMKIATQRTQEKLPFIELRGELDTDIELLCLVCTDTMEGVEAGPYAPYDSLAVIEAASDRIEAAADATDKQLFALMVGQPAGRTTGYGVREIDVDNLTVEYASAADLDSLAYVERDPLALWKFSRSCAEVRERGRIQSFSAIDTFALYREYEHSFGRLGEVNMLTVLPGMGTALRTEAKRERDRHPAPYVDGSLREVEREEESVFAENLYHLSDIVEPRLIRYVSGAPVALWAAGPSGAGIVKASWDLVETLAYWLGELRAPLRSRLRRFARHAPCLQLDIDVADRDFWFGDGEDPSGEDFGEFEIEGIEAHLILGPVLWHLASAADNGGERLLVRLMLEALDALFASVGVEGIPETERVEIVEAVAPLGQKKHLIAFPGRAGNEMLMPVEEDVRLIQVSDLTAARELLGANLIERFGHRGEEIPDEQRLNVVKVGVATLLEQVASELAGLDPKGLLEELLAANERVVHEAELRRALLLPRSLTYPAATERSHLREELARSNQAAVCVRFLIEHVTAQPPTGTEPWSLARYDRLMGLCAAMTEWAYFADALHYKMTNVGLLINEEGQLRLAEQDRYELGRAEHFESFVDDQRRGSEQIFNRRFDTEAEPTKSKLRERVDPLVEAEAGASLTELGELLHTAAAYGREHNLDVIVLGRDEVETELAEILAWDPAKISAAVDYLGMGARENFLEPPDGDWHDVVPSRFARRWSLTRRPFVFRGDQVLWGQRHVLGALQVIIGQFLSGRFQALAASKELEAELGRLADEAGAEFESEVASVFSDAKRFETAEGVTSVGGEKLARANGETLGDIDVLAADTLGRIIYCVECKDLAGALTPSEVAGELSEHFDGEGGETSAKHSERLVWLAERVEAALSELGIEGSAKGWRVKGMFVTGRPVMATYITDVAFEIVPIDDLESWIAALPRPRRRKKRRRRK